MRKIAFAVADVLANAIVLMAACPGSCTAMENGSSAILCMSVNPVTTPSETMRHNAVEPLWVKSPQRCRQQGTCTAHIPSEGRWERHDQRNKNLPKVLPTRTEKSVYRTNARRPGYRTEDTRTQLLTDVASEASQLRRHSMSVAQRSINGCCFPCIWPCVQGCDCFRAPRSFARRHAQRRMRECASPTFAADMHCGVAIAGLAFP